MEGEHLIDAPKETVWAGLNNPEILKSCIPGCVELIGSPEEGLEATVQAKIGPVKAKFKGAVTLSNIDAPNSYTITGEGKGGAAGFAKGGADVKLTEADGGTLLSYSVDAKVGGKLAQIGSRLVDASAKKLAAEFFDSFSEAVRKSPLDNEETNDRDSQPNPEAAAPPSETEVIEPTVTEDVKPASKNPAGLSPLIWVSAVIALVGILIYSFSG